VEDIVLEKYFPGGALSDSYVVGSAGQLISLGFMHPTRKISEMVYIVCKVFLCIDSGATGMIF
jgi:hypothetical protein